MKTIATVCDAITGIEIHRFVNIPQDVTDKEIIRKFLLIWLFPEDITDKDVLNYIVRRY